MDKVRRYAVYLLVIAGCGGLLFDFGGTIIGPALPYIGPVDENPGSLGLFTTSQVSHLSSAVVMCAALACLAAGPGVVVWLALSELMPGRIRANGMSIALFVNQMVAFAVADLFLPWQKACGYAVVFYSLAFFAFVYFLAATFILPETKGRTLEEIEKMWQKTKKGNRL